MVVFDVGGVLVRANHTWGLALAAAGVALPAYLDPEEAVFGLPEYLPYEAGRIPEEAYLAALGERTTARDPRALHASILGEEFPGALDLGLELKARGIPTAAFSNNNPMHWGRLTDPALYPAVASLDRRVASFDLGWHKPEPEAYAAFERVVGVRGEEIVFFDDNAANAAAARAAGWDAVHVADVRDPIAAVRAELRSRGLI